MNKPVVAFNVLLTFIRNYIFFSHKFKKKFSHDLMLHKHWFINEFANKWWKKRNENIKRKLRESEKDEDIKIAKEFVFFFNYLILFNMNSSCLFRWEVKWTREMKWKSSEKEKSINPRYEFESRKTLRDSSVIKYRNYASFTH